MRYLEVLVVEAVLHKVDQVGNDRLGSLCLQQIYKMVVGSRQEFYKDLADNTYTRLLDIKDFNVSKSLMISRQSFLNFLRE